MIDKQLREALALRDQAAQAAAALGQGWVPGMIEPNLSLLAKNAFYRARQAAGPRLAGRGR